MTPEELQAACKERARRWAAADTLRDYPALTGEDETEETLADELPKTDAWKVKKDEE